MRSLALSTIAVLGMIILGTSSTVAYAATQPDTKQAAAANMVTIQPGDSLSGIATTHESTAQRLFDANTSIENPDLIYPGNQVRVPSNDETLTARPMPAGAIAQTTAPVSQSSQRSGQSTAAPVASGSVWDQLAICEAGGNWAANTGNGYYGGLQFTVSSWQAVGGSGLPSDASREEQIMRGQALQSRQGWGAWPACTSKLGLR